MNDAENLPDRDDELAGALAVAPLDDVTRRRLVRAALDRAAPEPGAPDPAAPEQAARHRRLVTVLGVAASLLVGTVVGAVLVTRPEPPSTPTAARSEGRAESPKAGGAPPSAAAEAAPALAPAPPQALGNLGANADLAALARAVDLRLQQGRAGAAEDAASAEGPCVAGGPIGLVLVTAAGTATIAGRGVVVVVGPTPEGSIVVAALDPNDCSLIDSAPLPSA